MHVRPNGYYSCSENTSVKIVQGKLVIGIMLGIDPIKTEIYHVHLLLLKVI